MKYTIEGFSQEVAVGLGLDAVDLVLLRWIIDFYNSGMMEIRTFGEQRFFWVQYEYVMNDMPILGHTNKTSLGRRLRRMVTAGLLEFKMVPTGNGVKTFYSFNGECLVGLLSKHDEKTEPLDSKVKRVLTQKSRGSLLKRQELLDPSTKDPNTNDIYKDLFDYWNNKKIITHRNFDKFKPVIKSALEVYKADEVKDAMNNYGMVVIGDKYFFKWRWTLDQFLGRKNVIDRFLPENFKEKDYLKNTGNNDQVKQPAVSEDHLNKRLGKIATKEMIKNVLKEIPTDEWWRVEKFLQRRYPESDGHVVAEVKKDLLKEISTNKNKISELVGSTTKTI